MTVHALTFREHGAELHSAALHGDDIASLTNVFAAAGHRSGIVTHNQDIRRLVVGGSALFRIVAAQLAKGGIPRPVRAIVHDGADFNGYGPEFTQDRSPFSDVSERMVTLFCFLDAPDPVDALSIVPGSHCLGTLNMRDCKCARKMFGEARCDASFGDVWLLAKTTCKRLPKPQKRFRRRILEIDFAAEHAPVGEMWIGV